MRPVGDSSSPIIRKKRRVDATTRNRCRFFHSSGVGTIRTVNTILPVQRSRHVTMPWGSPFTLQYMIVSISVSASTPTRFVCVMYAGKTMYSKNNSCTTKRIHQFIERLTSQTTFTPITRYNTQYMNMKRKLLTFISSSRKDIMS